MLYYHLPDKLVRTPTDVKIDVNTHEYNVVPVRLLALTLVAVTPVSCDPLPIKYPADMLPVPLTMPVPNSILPPVTLPVVLKLVPVITPPTTLDPVTVPVTEALDPVITPPATLAAVTPPAVE